MREALAAAVKGRAEAERLVVEDREAAKRLTDYLRQELYAATRRFEAQKAQLEALVETIRRLQGASALLPPETINGDSRAGARFPLREFPELLRSAWLEGDPISAPAIRVVDTHLVEAVWHDSPQLERLVHVRVGNDFRLTCAYRVSADALAVGQHLPEVAREITREVFNALRDAASRLRPGPA